MTLLELAVAGALVLALAALVLPAVLSRLDAGQFDATRDGIIAVLAQARAEAQRTGQTVRVVADTRADRSFALYIEPYQPEPADPADLSNPFGLHPTVTQARSRRLELVLPAGFSLSTTLPSADDPHPVGGASAAPRPPAAGDSLPADPLATGPTAPASEVLTVALYLPDGTAMAGEARYLLGRTGRGARIELNPLTGRARLVPLQPLATRPNPDAAVVPPGDRR